MTEVMEGQMTIFDLDGWSGKTYLGHYPQTKAKTSESSSKKSAESKIRPPMFLDLRTANGNPLGASWEMGFQWLGQYTTRSIGAFPKEERESRLSEILEDTVQPRYYLSVKACQGILNRAKRRGKTLPPELQKALEKQAMM